MCVCLSSSHTFLVVTQSYVSQATHAFLGMLPLCFKYLNIFYFNFSWNGIGHKFLQHYMCSLPITCIDIFNHFFSITLFSTNYRSPCLLDLTIPIFISKTNIVAALRGMHVSPAKHSSTKNQDYQESVTTRQTDRRTDRRWTKWSLCAAILRRWHKNQSWPVHSKHNYTVDSFIIFMGSNFIDRKMIYIWGSEYVAIIFAFIIHTENCSSVGTSSPGCSTPQKPCSQI